MSWLAAVWRRLTLPFRSRAALVRLVEATDRARVDCEQQLAECVSRVARLEDDIAALRWEAEGCEARRLDALREAEERTRLVGVLHKRLEDIHVLAADMPLEWADQVRRYTRPELQEAGA